MCDFASACRRIEAGEVVLRDAGYGVVPWQETDCGHCLLAVPDAGGLCCEGCEARFCSSACMQAQRSVHEAECPALHALQSARDQLRCGTPDGLKNAVDARLVIRILALRAAEAEAVGEADKCTWVDVQALACCTDQLNAAGSSGLQVIRLYAAEAELIFKTLSPALAVGLTCADVKGLLLRIRFNCTQISQGFPAVLRGKGLYPMMAMLNHACNFNVHHSFPQCGAGYLGAGTASPFVLESRAIRTIEEGDEVSGSYIDTFQSRRQRAYLLQGGYIFQCACARCVDQDPFCPSLSVSADEMMCSLYCGANCPGLVLLPRERLSKSLPREDPHLKTKCTSCDALHDVGGLELIELFAEEKLLQCIQEAEQNPGLHTSICIQYAHQDKIHFFLFPVSRPRGACLGRPEH